MYDNFVRLHRTLRVSPAMAAGVTDRLWEMVDVVDVLDAFEAKRKRGANPVFLLALLCLFTWTPIARYANIAVLSSATRAGA